MTNTENLANQHLYYSNILVSSLVAMTETIIINTLSLKVYFNYSLMKNSACRIKQEMNKIRPKSTSRKHPDFLNKASA